MIGRPVVRLAEPHLPVADVDGREVARHRIVRLPDVGRPASAGRPALPDPVGYDVVARRHGDAEGVGRSIDGMIVHGEPRGRRFRFAGHDGPVACGHEAGGDPEVRYLEGARDPVVRRDDRERVPRRDRLRRRHQQLVIGPRPRRGVAVHRQGMHGEPDEIEAEAGEGLRRDGLDRGDATQVVPGRAVADREVVVLHVVPAVAVLRVVGVADAERPGRLARTAPSNRVERSGGAGRRRDEQPRSIPPARWRTGSGRSAWDASGRSGRADAPTLCLGPRHV